MTSVMEFGDMPPFYDPEDVKIKIEADLDSPVVKLERLDDELLDHDLLDPASGLITSASATAAIAAAASMEESGGDALRVEAV